MLGGQLLTTLPEDWRLVPNDVKTWQDMHREAMPFPTAEMILSKRVD